MKIGKVGIDKESISRFYQAVRSRLRENMHSKWWKNLLGIQINTNLGYSSIEIDESKIISSDNLIYWMLGLEDSNTNEVGVFCVQKNRTNYFLLLKIIYIHLMIMNV